MWANRHGHEDVIEMLKSFQINHTHHIKYEGSTSGGVYRDVCEIIDPNKKQKKHAKIQAWSF